MSSKVSGMFERLRRSSARLIGAYRRDVRGLAGIEMAFIFPVMLIIYFGLVDVTNLLSASRRVTITASTLADLTTQAPGVITKDDMDGFFNAASAIMDPFPSDQVSLELYGFTKDGDTVKLSWKYKNGVANCGTEPSADASLEALMTEGNDVVVSQVCFDWTPVTGQIFGTSPIKLDDKLVLRPRQSAIISCSNCS